MKKTLSILLAAATLLAACTKSEIAYEQPQEIGFKVVAGNITKAPVDGTTYPTGLNMYVNAYTTDLDNTAIAPNYIKNGEFTYLNTYGIYIPDADQPTGTTDAEKATNVWGGGSSSTARNPYYWPNEKNLHFSGFSKSGNVAEVLANVAYNPSNDVLTITGYELRTATGEDANDLMWFQSTKHSVNAGYGKSTKFVPVDMYHTCSWITFMVQGDATTGSSNSTYTIKSLKMNGVDKTADVICTGNTALSSTSLPTYVVWSNNTDQTDAATPDNVTYAVSVPTDGVSLASTYNTTATPKNIETEATTTTGGNIVVIPQKPGTIDLTWTYTSSTNATISDSATGLSLKLTTSEDDPANVWQPGKHYVYTITIKANEILIAPTPVVWTDYTPNPNVTVN